MDKMVGQLSELYKFYNQKTVLVTGHTGFKGSWLSLWLEKMGATVIGVGLDPNNENDNFNLSQYKKLVDYRFDIRDAVKLKEVFFKHNPEIIFHLAAQPLVIESYKNPMDTYDVNVNGTLNLLECVRALEKDVTTVIITTDKVYKNTDKNVAFKETDALGGHDPYSSSKAMVEILVESYYKSFLQCDSKYKKGLATARAGNVIGGGDWSKDRLIPDLIQAYKSNNQINLRNPNSKRPWQFVLEPLFGYLHLGLKLLENTSKFSGAWNFGPNKMIKNLSVIEIIKIFNDFIDAQIEINILNKNNFHESSYLSLDSSKANESLRWYNFMTPIETFKKTFDWYTKYLDTKSIDNLSYIEVFEGLVTNSSINIKKDYN